MKYHILIAIYINLLSCSFNETQKQVDKSDVQIIDTIPFRYNQDEHKAIFLDIILGNNDTITALFDTGVYGVRIPNSLKEKYFLQKDSFIIKIGALEKIFTGRTRSTALISLKKVLGKDGIILGWDFFNDKIIEISYSNKSMRILESIKYLKGYDKVKFTISRDNNLIIPITIYMQNYKFRLNAVIDTGFNGVFISSSEFMKNINTSGVDQLSAVYSGKTNFKTYILPIDSLLVGDIRKSNVNIAVSNINMMNLNKEKEGLLGNEFLENFSVIFDFMNYNLYLKPVKD